MRIAGVGRAVVALALLALPARAGMWTLQVAPRAAGPDPAVLAPDPGRIVQPEIPGVATALLWASWGAAYPDSVAWRVIAAPTGITVSWGLGERWWVEPGEIRRQEVRITTDPRVLPIPCVVTVALEPIP